MIPSTMITSIIPLIQPSYIPIMTPVMDKIWRLLSKRNVQKDLIRLYQKSHREYTKNGKMGMEIGASKEKDLTAVFQYYMGKDQVVYDTGYCSPEDIRIGGEKFSIKHISTAVGASSGSIKVKWTADNIQAKKLIEDSRTMFGQHMLIVYWDNKKNNVTILGIEQEKIQNGIYRYNETAFHIRSGTNNRGVQFSRKMLDFILKDPAFSITIPDVHLHSSSSSEDPIQQRCAELKRYNESMIVGCTGSMDTKNDKV